MQTRGAFKSNFPGFVYFMLCSFLMFFATDGCSIRTQHPLHTVIHGFIDHHLRMIGARFLYRRSRLFDDVTDAILLLRTVIWGKYFSKPEAMSCSGSPQCGLNADRRSARLSVSVERGIYFPNVNAAPI